MPLSKVQSNSIATAAITSSKLDFSVPSSFADLNSYGFVVSSSGNQYCPGDNQVIVKNFSSWSSNNVSVFKNNSSMFTSSDFCVTIPKTGVWSFTSNVYRQDDGTGGTMNGATWLGPLIFKVDGSYNTISTYPASVGGAWNTYRHNVHGIWNIYLTVGDKMTIGVWMPNESTSTRRISQVHWAGSFLGS